MPPKETVTIHTDGACIGNPGPGGYGVVIRQGGRRRELSGGFQRTTNNRMELIAVIEALKAVEDRSTVTLDSDSQYVINAVNEGWASRWRSNGWRRTKNHLALNPDLWELLLNQVDRHDVTLRWVKGHAGNPGNERADALAVKASKSSNLAVDTGYKAPTTRSAQRRS